MGTTGLKSRRIVDLGAIFLFESWHLPNRQSPLLLRGKVSRSKGFRSRRDMRVRFAVPGNDGPIAEQVAERG